MLKAAHDKGLLRGRPNRTRADNNVLSNGGLLPQPQELTADGAPRSCYKLTSRELVSLLYCRYFQTVETPFREDLRIVQVSLGRNK